MLAGNFSSNWSRYVENIISSFFHLFFIPFSFIFFSFFLFFLFRFSISSFFFFFIFIHMLASFLSIFTRWMYFSPRNNFSRHGEARCIIYFCRRARMRGPASSGAILQSPPRRNDIFRRNFKCFDATGTITIAHR